MADIDLPLWSVPPNWRTPVTERLEWLTDVMGSRSGAEQRRSIRLSPRRFFEYLINPVGAVRSFADQWFHRIADAQCLLPLWHDKARTTSVTLDTANRVDVATAYREFAVGGLAVLYSGPFTHALVEISAIDANGLDIANTVAGDWPAGSAIYPVRRAYMDPEVKFSALTGRVGESTLAFMIDGTNDYDLGTPDDWLIGGYPVIDIAPNRMDDLEAQYTRIMDEIDNRIGLTKRNDVGGRAFQTQFYNWQAKGLQEHHELRQLLYRLNGRQKAVWMPSFNEDVTLARPLLSASSALDVEAFGYTALGGVVPGRDRLHFRTDSDHYSVEIEDTDTPLAAGEERLLLTAAAGFALPAGQTGSFMGLVRLEQDAVEITHHTDAEGVCEVSAAFKSFAPIRTPPTVLIQPLLVGTENSDPCGLPPPPAWALRMILEIRPGLGGASVPGRGLTLRRFTGGSGGFGTYTSTYAEGGSTFFVWDYFGAPYDGASNMQLFIQYDRFEQNALDPNDHYLYYQRPNDDAPTLASGPFEAYGSSPNYYDPVAVPA